MVGANGNLDYLYNRGWRLHGIDSTDRTTTSTSATDLVTISSLSIPVAQPILIVGGYRKSSGAAAAVGIGLKVNATTVIEAATSAAMGHSSATNQAEDGSFMWLIGPRSASYLAGVNGFFHTRVSSTGAVAQAVTLAPGSAAWVALIPNATVTSIIIRGISGSGSVTLGAKDVAVFAGGVTL